MTYEEIVCLNNKAKEHCKKYYSRAGYLSGLTYKTAAVNFILKETDKGIILVSSLDKEKEINSLNDIFYMLEGNVTLPRYIKNISIIKKFRYILNRYYLDNDTESFLWSKIYTKKSVSFVIKKKEDFDKFLSRKVLLGGFKIENYRNILTILINDNSAIVYSDIPLIITNRFNFRSFYGNEIYVDSFDMSEVTKLDEWFMYMTNLDKVVLRNFNATNLISMESMFQGCSGLREVLLENFNIVRCRNLSCMFYKCESLREINLSCFNTINVLDISHMFEKCINLKSIDITGCSMDKIIRYKDMFLRCDKLVEIKGKKCLISNKTISKDNYILMKLDRLRG